MPTKPRSRLIRVPRVTIKITEATLARAVKRSDTHCWISESIREQVPYATSISSDARTIRWTDTERGVRVCYETPKKAVQGLLYFDAGVVPEPFTLSLPRPQWITQSTAKPKPTKPAKKKAAAKKSTARKSSAAAFRGGARIQSDGTIIGSMIRPIGHTFKQRRFGMKAFTP